MLNKGKILIIDDDMSTIKALNRVLMDSNYIVVYTTDPKESLIMIKEESFDVILCDQRMPGISGIEVLKSAKEISPRTARILITGYSDLNTAISAINDSQVFNYIEKPWKNDEVIDIIDKAVHLKRIEDDKEAVLNNIYRHNEEWVGIIKKLQKEIKKKNNQVVSSLLKIIKAKDLELYRHSKNVSDLALQLASWLKFTDEQKQNILYAGLFHDIGKIAIRDKILYKPGQLDDKEFREVEYHPIVGAEIMKELDFMLDVSKIICQHHEKLNGGGYPYGLTEKKIIMEAKILSIADAFEALTSDRVYRKKFSQQEAIEIMLKEAGKSFDKDILKVFIGGLKGE